MEIFWLLVGGTSRNRRREGLFVRPENGVAICVCSSVVLGALGVRQFSETTLLPSHVDHRSQTFWARPVFTLGMRLVYASNDTLQVLCKGRFRFEEVAFGILVPGHFQKMPGTLLVHAQVRDGAALELRRPACGWEAVGERHGAAACLCFSFSPVECLRAFDDLRVRDVGTRMPALNIQESSGFCVFARSRNNAKRCAYREKIL